MKHTVKIAARGERELVITRAFDAPRKLVYEAYTKPELVKQWLLGPDGWTMPVCEMDVRVGGKYRFLWRNAGGMEMGSAGVFREVVKNERLVQTERFDEAWYSGESVITITFVETAGVTTLTTVCQYESKEARDHVLASPMESGLSVSYDRLEQMLSS